MDEDDIAAKKLLGKSLQLKQIEQDVKPIVSRVTSVTSNLAAGQAGMEPTSCVNPLFNVFYRLASNGFYVFTILVRKCGLDVFMRRWPMLTLMDPYPRAARFALKVERMSGGVQL
jgi:hypothetical protein